MCLAWKQIQVDLGDKFSLDVGGLRGVLARCAIQITPFATAYSRKDLPSELQKVRICENPGFQPRRNSL